MGQNNRRSGWILPTLNTLDKFGRDGDFDESGRRAKDDDTWDNLFVQYQQT